METSSDYASGARKERKGSGIPNQEGAYGGSQCGVGLW